MALKFQWRHVIVCVSILILLFVVGCQSVTSPASAPTGAIDTRQAPATIGVETDQPNTPAQTQQPAKTTTPAIKSPTPAPTLSDWREAPISPTELSSQVIEIYRTGQTQGRDPASFSVVGDCQSIPFVFMGPFGRGAQAPDASESQLWKAINYFEPSFKRWAVTARGGFTAASVINPLQADPAECKPGETPLTCEFRLNNPAFVLITLETWLEPETVDRYEVYLRKILDTVIANGAVPILLTKADSSELKGERHVINPVIVNLAYEYQVPVVNFWRAAQYLDNYGIDPEREGFHLSETGYALKNTLALRALHQVWTAVTAPDAIVESNGSEAAPAPTIATANLLEPKLTQPNCKEDCVFFGAAQSQDGSVTAQGVYAYDPKSQSLTQVLEAGFNLQDVNVDGTKLLVNNEARLFTVDLGTSQSDLISESFAYKGQQGAFWNDQDEWIFLDDRNPIQTKSGEAFALFPNRTSADIYFNSGTCTANDFCKSDGVFSLQKDGTVSELATFQQPVFSPDGSRVAFLNPGAATKENYFHINYLITEETAVGAASRRVLYLPEESGFMVFPEVAAYAFSPDSSQLFIFYNVYSEYYEKSLHLQTYLWNLETGILYNMGRLDDASASLNPRVVWSPDGSKLLLFLTDLSSEGDYTISVYQTDLVTGEKLVLVKDALIKGMDYIYLTNTFWH